MLLHSYTICSIVNYHGHTILYTDDTVTCWVIVSEIGENYITQHWFLRHLSFCFCLFFPWKFCYNLSCHHCYLWRCLFIRTIAETTLMSSHRLALRVTFTFVFVYCCYFSVALTVNSNASETKVKPRLSDAHMGDSSSSLLSQEGSQVEEIPSGKSSPLVCTCVEVYNNVWRNLHTT